MVDDGDVVLVPHAPIVSPCAACAGQACTLIVIVTDGFVAEAVRWQIVTFPDVGTVVDVVEVVDVDDELLLVEVDIVPVVEVELVPLDVKGPNALSPLATAAATNPKNATAAADAAMAIARRINLSPPLPKQCQISQ